VYLASRKEVLVGTAEGFEEKRVYKGRKSESEWGHISLINRSRHQEDFPAFFEDASCPTKNEFAWTSCGNTAPSSSTHEDREADVIFEFANLLTHCGLRTMNSLRSLGEVLSFMDGKQVYKVAELHSIGHGLGTPLIRRSNPQATGGCG
jgi:hypothetical protein